MGFRLAFGSGKVADYLSHPDRCVRELCTRIQRKLESLSSLPVAQLAVLPEEKSQVVAVGTREAVLTVFHHPTGEGQTLVVVQGFLPIWRPVRYIGSAGVGLMLAEGLFIESNKVQSAKDEYLWGYR